MQNTAMTSTETLLEMIPTLSTQEQDAVKAFIRYLKEEKTPTPISADEAFQDFVSKHSELLRLLAQ